MRERPPYIDPLAEIREEFSTDMLTRMFIDQERKSDPFFQDIGERYSEKEGTVAVWAGYELLKYGSERESE